MFKRGAYRKLDLGGKLIVNIKLPKSGLSTEN